MSPVKTLTDLAARRELLDRLQRLTPDTVRLWGKMDAHQMICHLSDSFRLALGERPAASVATPFSRTVLKWVALRAPMRWPPGVKTIPEVDATINGTKPLHFERDRQELEALLKQFCDAPPDFAWYPHPIFDHLSRAEWQRWGYLHMDHHFRQFGL